jgi:hypothetical protein
MTFKLKSGNKPGFKKMGSSPAKDMKTGSYKQSFESPAKQTVGGDAGEVIDHWKKYQAEKGKMPKNFNIKGSPDVWDAQSKDILSRNKPSKLIKVPDVDVINKKLTDIGKGTTKKVTKKVVKKGLGKTILKGAGKVAKFAAKRIGPVGAAITAYEVAKAIPKVVKATKKSLKKEAKTGSTVGKPKY